MKSPRRLATSTLAVVCGVALAAAGCSSSDSGPNSGSSSDDGAFTISVTTSVWGDIVEHAFGDEVSVTVLMPPDADPHHFEPSTKTAAELESTDLIVENGAGLEASFAAVIDAAQQSGTPVFTIADHVETRTIDGEGGPVDPHIWLDPNEVARAVLALAVELDAAGVDGALITSNDYLRELAELNDEIEVRLAPIPQDRRVLVTSHDSLGYYADAYDLTVVDTIVGSVSTDAEPSVAELEDVVTAIDEYGVNAIFVDPGQSDKLASAIASETDRDVKVVALPTEGLSDSTDYPTFMRQTTELIADGLTS